MDSDKGLKGLAVLRAGRRHWSILSLFVLCIALAAGSISPVQASPGDPLGEAFRIDINGSAGFEPLVARNGAGQFVVVWTGATEAQQIYDWRLFARLYEADGTPRTGPVQLPPMQAPLEVALAIDGAGNFIVSWLADSDRRIDFQRVSADGVLLGSVQSVQSAANLSGGHAIAMNESGDFVLAWRQGRGLSVPLPIIDGGYGSISLGVGSLVARRFSANGAPMGTPTQIVAELTAPELLAGPRIGVPPSVGLDAAGNAIVTWVDSTPSGTSIKARRIKASGAVAGPAFTVSSQAVQGASNPVVSVAPTGDFAIVYEARHMTGPQTSSGTDIHLRRYAASGKALDAGQSLSDSVGVSPPTLALAANGQAVVAWTGTAAPYCCASSTLQFQLVGADGARIGPNTQAVAGSTSNPAVASDANGNFVLVWTRGGAMGVLEGRLFAGH